MDEVSETENDNEIFGIFNKVCSPYGIQIGHPLYKVALDYAKDFCKKENLDVSNNPMDRRKLGKELTYKMYEGFNGAYKASSKDKGSEL